MTLFYQHRDRHRSPIGTAEFPVSLSSVQVLIRRLGVFARRAIGRIGAGFTILHQAIVTTKTRRVQRERMFDEIPQQPLIFGDKWDF